MAAYEPIIVKNGKRYFYRFSAHQRIQHVILFTSVIILALTGFPLRHTDEAWSKPLYDFFGGPDLAPTIHRLAGTVLLVLFVYHTLYWLVLFIQRSIIPLYREGRLNPWTALQAFGGQVMIPNGNDGRDLVDTFKFLFYISNKPSRSYTMSWREKFDYFAVYWGIPVIGPAGAVLWWRDEISHIVPGWVLNGAYIMHTDESLLAVLFLFFVHWYNVHYAPEKFPGATVWLSGYLSEPEMMHEHYSEYVQQMTEAGLAAEIKKQHFGV